MNRKIATALVLAATTAAGSAFAETPFAVQPDNFTSTRTRAEVQAELHAYKKAGVNHWSFMYNPLRSFQSTLTREQVVADYVASREEMAAIHSEDSGSAYFSRQAGTRQGASTTLAGQPTEAR
jgi:hypothetical protein